MGWIRRGTQKHGSPNQAEGHAKKEQPYSRYRNRLLFKKGPTGISAG